MLRFVVDSARAVGIEVSLCGEMAAQYAPLLVGLGFRRLSMSPRTVPTVKTRIRQLTADRLRELSDACGQLETSEQVAERLQRFLDAAEAEAASQDNLADGRRSAAAAADHEMLA